MLPHICYTAHQQENGNILLRQFVIDAGEYDTIRMPNGDLLLKKIEEIKIREPCDLKLFDFASSAIDEARVGGTIQDKKSYIGILETVYHLIGNGAKIIKSTTINVQTLDMNDYKYKYYPALGISVQRVNSNTAIYEIASQCVLCGISLLMRVKLESGVRVVVKIGAD